MPGAATITAFQGQTPPWSLISLDANFTALNALMKDVGNYSTYIADAGGANAYSCTYGASLTFSLSTGVKVVFKAANANTGASTLNVNATGIKNILNVDGSALTANQIVAGGIYTVVYDGTQYQLLNPTQARPGAMVMSGNLTWATDNTYDIGASGANRARDLFLGRNAAIGGNLVVSGTGPHAIGGATGANSQWLQTGSFSGASDVYGYILNATLTPAANGLGLGVNLAPTLNKAGSGTHSDFATLYVQPPTIGAGAATLTNATTLKITSAPSVGTNQRALWVAAGASEFGGFIKRSDGTNWFYFDLNGANGLIQAATSASAAIPIQIWTGTAEIARFTAGGYFKASNSGTYDSATGTYHENYQTASGSYVSYFTHSSATNPDGVYIHYSGTAPNDTTHDFLTAADNSATRFDLRSNGGLANFSANNVNLCSLSVKKDFTPLADVPGMLDRMWEAHRELDWAQYRYKDQTHEEFNYGPSAERVHELFTARGIPLTDAWQPEKMHTGAVTIGGLSYDYAVRGDNPDSPLGITGDFAYVTGAMVSYAQKRIERIEAALVKAKLL